MLSFPYAVKSGIRAALVCTTVFLFSCSKETATVNDTESALENVQKTEALAATSVSATGVSYQYLARNAAELQSALKYAQSGQVIFIPSNVNIDCTNERILYLKGGVTIQSDRGLKNSNGTVSNGGSIFTKNKGHRPLISVQGNNAKILRLRVLGPDTLEQKALVTQLYKAGTLSTLEASRGVDCQYDSFTVDNSEFCGWSHAAIFLIPGAQYARITNNYIHHNRRWLTGYGVNFSAAQGLVAYNVFDKNRHAVAGWGTPGTSYEAAYNTIISSTQQAFDMHGGANRGDGTNIAGTRIYIHHNTIYSYDWAAFINGVPQQECVIQYNNCYQSTQKDAMFAYTSTKTKIRYNTYGIPKKTVSVALKSY